MSKPLMPKATAVWLVENTSLTFEQIAAFCGMHELEVQAIADGEVGMGMQGLNPVLGGELTQAEIDRCQTNPAARLVMSSPSLPEPRQRAKGARYTPVSKRQDRPDAIAWLLKNFPELSDAQVSKLIGTTKPTIGSVREKTHWNTPNIKPRNPVGLGLCSEGDLEKAVAIARARTGTVHAPAMAGSPLQASPPAAELPLDDEDEPRSARKPEVTAETLFRTFPKDDPTDEAVEDSEIDAAGDGGAPGDDDASAERASPGGGER